MPGKPRCRHCINVSSNKTSYLLLRRKVAFPAVPVAGAAPTPGQIAGVSVQDDDNSIFFTATAISQQVDAAGFRLAIKVVSNLGAGGGADPTDGLLLITLLIANGTAVPNQVNVSDTPVNYISDPNGP